MSEHGQKFKSESAIAFDEEHWQKMNYATNCYERRFANSRNNYRNVELERERAHLLRNKSLLNMEKLLVEFETRFNMNGGQVLWACDSDDALQMIWDIVGKTKTESIARSTSTVLDEIGINEFLEGKRIQVFETSIGRYILKLMGKAPYHPVFSTMNLSKEEIGGLLNEHFKLRADSSSKQMVNFIRHQVNQDLAKAQVCLTGANFLLSDVGGVVLTENEGNILKSCASARVHIVVAGIDKIISSIEDLGVLLPLTSAHAIGNEMTPVNSITIGPSGETSSDKMYVILLNNGRTDLLGNEVVRQSLSCVHCGACVSVCPIYKNIGGYVYGSPYIGPIGTVMTPLMFDLDEFAHLASLCTLCGRCSEVCPVKIPIEDLIVENRRIVTEEHAGDGRYDSLVRTLIGHCKSRKKMDCPQWLKKMELKQTVNKNAFTKRVMPELAPKSFNQLTKTEN